ncbi:aminotransferase class III-fold pyridoxal phosphate-dependent enzyme [Luteimonas sp. MC1825]|uniref:aminotransferase class III-fold pyridoxal phosphate-dependent enzyme n=1 Tax=Luteimonas sp. MC1825 TaxID=2761107 RepID=UPI00161EFD6D|nr:aminotransferase class III-fold pyridoxal phosphate-dependent enzyme [Luteimonas sp. MC1825]MBB6598145.1 aminotransferase class III-fold pyridoxal phosphate-dependent enzyme [Luteimonas sp. MC1825]QOC88377.1 aminotransferase class III-fold pyridoxal phosphate-dependent enzyme [Luteimonas sp. MC1825]
MGTIGQLRVAKIVDRLRAVAADLSGYEPADLVETTTFLDLGFDSLFLTQLASAFQGEYGVKITFRQLFDELPTLHAMAEHLDRTLPPDAVPVHAPGAATAAPVEAMSGEGVVAERVPAVEPPALAMTDFAASFAAVSNALPGSAGGLQDVMAQQLLLMSQQIQLLQALKGAALPHAAPVAAPAAAAAPQPADVAVAPHPAATPQGGTAAAASAMPKGFGPQVSREERVLTRRQREHIQRLTARYNARTMGSKRHVQQHRPHHADPRTAAGFNRLWKEMVYPIVIEGSHGCRLRDIDGNEYIDILNGFGPNFLGHSPSFISDALKAQLDKGIEVGPQTPLAGEAAELFCELTGMDRVSWVNTGSEAVQAAIRLSRTYTGREKIVVFSGDYHGNFDEVLVRVTKNASGARRTFPLAPGIPFRAVENVLVLDYGEEESLEIIRRNAGDIAAVLVEPVQSRRPEFQPHEFLKKLRTLTEDEGIVLVFDEVITGFRIRPGGAQEYYGIKADLATYGKIIGGGMPIGVVAGRARFMDTFDGGQWQYGDDSFPAAGVTFFAGTFVRHPLAIAAVHAALRYIKAQGPALQDTVNRRTTYLTTELNGFFKERGLKIHIPHFASQMFIRVQEEGELATLLFFHLRARGIHVLENFPSYMTAAHGDDDVEAIIAAFKDSILEMQADGLLPAPPVEAPALAWRRTLPLTDAQRELWFASQMGDMASCAFNESDSVRIDGPLDAARFVAAVETALGEQEAFRYRFDDEGATQWVDDDATFQVPVVDLSALGGAERQQRIDALLKQEALTPFDLARGPLVRAQLLKLGPDSHLFVVYCHHIVFDGYSADVLLGRIAEIHGAEPGSDVDASASAVPFSAYIHLTTSPAARASQAQALEYWRGVYARLPEPLDLPVDHSRRDTGNHRGATLHRDLDAAVVGELKDAAKSLKTSLNVFLLSGFQALLSRLSAQEDVVVGMPVAGQAHTGLKTVGYCVNALPLRAATGQDKPFRQLVAETQRSMFDAIEHQDVTLGQLVRALQVPREAGRQPLVDVVFNYSRFFSRLDLQDCTVSTHENPRQAFYYDTLFNIIEHDGRLAIDWDYSADVFDEQTISLWIDCYLALLRGAARDNGLAIGALPLTDEVDQADARVAEAR